MLVFALSLAHHATTPLPPAVRAVWEAFLAPTPVQASQVMRHMPHGRLSAEEIGGGEELLEVRQAGRFPGGIDLYTEPGGAIQEGLFYLAPIGPLYLRAQYEAASRVRSPYTLAQAIATYGKPDVREVKPHGITELAWHRGRGVDLVVTSLPDSNQIHRVIVERE